MGCKGEEGEGRVTWDEEERSEHISSRIILSPSLDAKTASFHPYVFLAGRNEGDFRYKFQQR